MNRHPEPESSAIEVTAARWVARRDAGLTAEEARELQDWINADPRHRAAIGYYGATWATLAKPAVGGAGAILEGHLAKLSARRRRRRIAAAAVAVTMLACILVLNTGERSVDPGPASALVLAPSRQTLPDGSLVELKENARIAVDFSRAARRVTLEAGEAHFVVRKDSARPFVVSAASVDVRAIGTAFSVKKESAAIEVLVTQGKVAVEKPAGSTPGEAVSPARAVAELAAGRLAVVEIAPATIAAEVRTLPPVELSQRLAWRSPRVEFTRTPLSEAVALINRHAPPNTPPLAIGDPDVAVVRITGVFRADNVDGFVLLLEGAFGVKAERNEGMILLRRAR